MPLFSIIIPVYKVENYLHKCVNSVLSQEYKDYEIILVDDGSPDNCSQICDEFAAVDNRIKVIHKANGGLSDARNVGIKAAEGEYLMFLDSDDYWEGKSHLSNIAELIEKNPTVDTIILKHKLLFESTNTTFEKSINYEKLLDNNPDLTLFNLVKSNHQASSAWSRVVRRDIIIENKIYFTKGLTGEDSDWFIHLSLFIKKYLVYNETIYVYRQNRVGSITDTIKIKNIKDQLYIIDKWNQILNSDNYSNNLYLGLKGFLAYLFSIVIFLTSKLSKQERDLMIEEIKKRDDIFNYAINEKSLQTRFLYKLLGPRLTSIFLSKIYNVRSKIRK